MFFQVTTVFIKCLGLHFFQQCCRALQLRHITNLRINKSYLFTTFCCFQCQINKIVLVNSRYELITAASDRMWLSDEKHELSQALVVSVVTTSDSSASFTSSISLFSPLFPRSPPHLPCRSSYLLPSSGPFLSSSFEVICWASLSSSHTEGLWSFCEARTF